MAPPGKTVLGNDSRPPAVMARAPFPEAKIKSMDEAKARWALEDALVIHRYGRLGPQEQIMMVATAAPHRADAFAAAEFLMDYLKSRAPFWKKEIGADGAEWVAAKASDEDALTRW